MRSKRNLEIAYRSEIPDKEGVPPSCTVDYTPPRERIDPDGEFRHRELRGLRRLTHEQTSPIRESSVLIESSLTEA
jgi:hypothetical protein